MPKTVKHGNISIEKAKKGYFIWLGTENNGSFGMPCTEDELHDLELCLHKLKGWEITEQEDKRWIDEEMKFNQTIQ